MPTLFIRTIIVYSLMFAVLRLMGKRQINDMQPFDLAVTLLIANLASIPMADAAIPLLYGVIPIIALFIIQWLVSRASLKSESVRTLVCGSPLVIISKGILLEDVMKAANYSLSDLCEQLRLKDIFSISKVEYAILETNGSLSVLLKGPFQAPTNEQLALSSESARPAFLLVTDGKIHKAALDKAGIDEKKLGGMLKKLGASSVKDLLFVSLDADGIVHSQLKNKRGADVSPKFFNISTFSDQRGKNE